VPIALVLTLIAVVSTAFLVYQYVTGSLLVDDAANRPAANQRHGAERPVSAAEPGRLREFKPAHDTRTDTAA
jgi:hypothetical protein